MEAVLEAFASERLLTLAAGTVEISHEVLLTAWPLLRDTWLAETHSDRIVRTRLHHAAAEWAGHDRDSSYLYQGSLLEDAAATAARISADPDRYPPLSHAESDFLQASQQGQRRRVRRRQGIVAGLVALVIGLASTTFLAARANQESITARDAAVAGQLITQSEKLGDSNPVLAKQESLAAWQIDPSEPAARYAMLTAARLPGVGVLTSDGASVNAVAYRPGGKILATGSGNGTVRLWDVRTQRQIGAPLGPFRHTVLNSVAFSPDGTMLAAAGQDGVVRLWDVATRRPVGQPLAGDKSAVRSIAFSPAGGLLAAGHNDGTVELWDTASGRRAGALGQAGQTLAVAFSPDGRLLVTGGYYNADHGAVQLWDVGSGRPVGSPLLTDTFTGSLQYISQVAAVAFSPDGRTVAAGEGDGLVGLWNVTSRKEAGLLITADTSSITSVAFSPDGKTLATGSNDGTVRLWDLPAGRPAGSLHTTGAVYAVAFNRDGTKLATGGFDGTAQLWDVAARRQIGSFSTGQDWSIFSVAFSPDGKTLATGSTDDTARLWDVSTHQQIGAPISGAVNSVASVAFSPDGRTLAAGYTNGVVQLWNVRYLTNVVSFLCASTGGSFTRAQWVQYVPGPSYQRTCSPK